RVRDRWLRGVQAAEDVLQYSGVVFAGANSGGDGQENGVLTAAEVLGLDLSGTDTVVLSACQTGLGRELSGEGIYGLKRAFSLAGARHLILSLWSVDDQGTRALMVRFYRHRMEGMPVADALRRAKLDLLTGNPELESDGLASSADQFRSPAVWAAFVASGAVP
ncbi:MAG: CHAT domain-containing protein, partial [Candidatus Eremiobacterota bacterium]